MAKHKGVSATRKSEKELERLEELYNKIKSEETSYNLPYCDVGDCVFFTPIAKGSNTGRCSKKPGVEVSISTPCEFRG